MHEKRGSGALPENYKHQLQYTDTSPSLEMETRKHRMLYIARRTLL